MIMTDRKQGFFSAEWTRSVQLADGRVFHLSVRRGKRVRIPYKKRGQNVGYHWIGSVHTMPEGRVLFEGRVAKTAGVRALLSYAGVEEITLIPAKKEAS